MNIVLNWLSFCFNTYLNHVGLPILLNLVFIYFLLQVNLQELVFWRLNPMFSVIFWFNLKRLSVYFIGNDILQIFGVILYIEWNYVCSQWINRLIFGKFQLLIVKCTIKLYIYQYKKNIAIPIQFYVKFIFVALFVT